MNASIPPRIIFYSRIFTRSVTTESTIRSITSQKQYRPQPRISRIERPTSDSWSIPKRRLAQLGGVAVFFVGLFAAYSTFGPPPKKLSVSQVPDDVSNRYNKIAKSFDRDVDFLETVAGYGWLRSWITKQAKGNVLEVSVGTGRNFEYFNLKNCNSITFLDQSQEMVDVAAEKFQKSHAHYKASRFLTQSTHDPITTPPGGFDTILQTMGICSVADPVRLLRHLGSLVNPHHGRILLLEHGLSHYAWLNTWLDSSAANHADKYGCWWNKNIGRIVEESGLEIVKMKRYHLGTTWWIELKPKIN